MSAKLYSESGKLEDVVEFNKLSPNSSKIRTNLPNYHQFSTASHLKLISGGYKVRLQFE